MLIVIQKGISIKMPMQTESYCAHLSIEPFKYLLDHHIAVEWEGIFKRSYYLKFKAVWMKWETIYSHAAWFLTVKREGGTGLGRVIIVHNFAERRINFWQKYYSMRYIPMHHNKQQNEESDVSGLVPAFERWFNTKWLPSAVDVSSQRTNIIKLIIHC